MAFDSKSNSIAKYKCSKAANASNLALGCWLANSGLTREGVKGGGGI